MRRSHPGARPLSCSPHCSICSGRTTRSSATRSGTGCSPAGSCRTSCSAPTTCATPSSGSCRTCASGSTTASQDAAADAVVRRSYSALALAILAYRDVEDHFLPADEVHWLLDAAINYLLDETDRRGHVPELGWINATAHAADLLKFLVRNPLTDESDHRRVLDRAAGAAHPARGTSVRRRRGGPPRARRGRRDRPRDDQRRRAV